MPHAPYPRGENAALHLSLLAPLGAALARLRWRHRGLAVALALSTLSLAPVAHAQSETPGAELMDEAATDTARLSTDEALRLLAEPLPEAREPRYALLQRQARAAQQLEDRARYIALTRQLLDGGRGQPDGERWITTYLNAEFTWGSSGLALQACEPFVGDSTLSLATRAAVALRQTYFAAQAHDRNVLLRSWARADALSAQALKEGRAPRSMELSRLQVRSEVERWQGDRVAAVATLREAVRLGRRLLAEARGKSSDERNPATLDAYGWLDGSLGMLTYALVRQGRPQEAISIAQDNLALWRSGKLSEGLGARWSYRLATSLNAVQQFEGGLAAARQADEMLQRAGSSAASHTRWLARQEMVRALIGLERWQEADAAYREFLASMPDDLLARTRASDPRLLALLAAKNGRFDEALQGVERSYRHRLRLYGANHPETQEMAGLRAVVNVLRGDMARALPDYETLFKATLDTPGGWQDLELRGVRGYVFGIAFQEFMRYVAAHALQGEVLDPALTDRALQIADRNAVGVTQRALTDSTARVLAATPALRQLLEQEQTQRRAEGELASQQNALLAQEDQLRREAQTEAFKALTEEERKPNAASLKAVRDQSKALQARMVAARGQLSSMREDIAKQFPAYADLVTPTLPRRAPLRALLTPGEALLVVYPTDKATLVWLVAASGQDGFTASPLGAAELAKRVAALRTMLDLGAAESGREPSLQAAQLYALYRDLLGPLHAQLSKVQSLIVAAKGSLASLPFAALVVQAPAANAAPDWLVQHMAVTQVPSPSALLALRRVTRPTLAAKALMGFGDPLFKREPAAGTKSAAARPLQLMANPVQAGATRYDADSGLHYADIAALPETRTELQAVAAALGANAKTDLVFGAQATRRAVLEARLADRRVVAFATHGLMPGELPGVSKPALAMAADADEHESPLLELDDVLGLQLNAQWVLLSACNTAAGVQNEGAMSGLVRGFFFAGARSVLATHWAVESDSAAALSSATFAQAAKPGVSRGESLRQAQLSMLDGTLGNGNWRHPFYWAGYALFGDPVR